MKLAILMYGLESEKSELKAIENKIQGQLNQTSGPDEAELIYFVDNGENTIEEKQAWLTAQTEAKKYVFITATTEIPANFVLLRLNAIKYGKPTEKLVELGVYSK